MNLIINFSVILHLIFLEPVELIGEGKYNLDAVKEITVTESYLGMDMDTRKCQNDEPIENCTTRQYMETVSHLCGCLPLSITTNNNVNHNSNTNI